MKHYVKRFHLTPMEISILEAGKDIIAERVDELLRVTGGAEKLEFKEEERAEKREELKEEILRLSGSLGEFASLVCIIQGNFGAGYHIREFAREELPNTE